MNEVANTAAKQQEQNHVHFIHLRNWEDKEVVKDGETKTIKVPASKGGITVAYIFEGTTLSFEYAKCCIRDNFCRRRGRVISSGRLREEPFILYGIEPEVLHAKREEQQSFVLACLAQEIPEEGRADFFAMTNADPMQRLSAPPAYDSNIGDEPLLAAE